MAKRKRSSVPESTPIAKTVPTKKPKFASDERPAKPQHATKAVPAKVEKPVKAKDQAVKIKEPVKGREVTKKKETTKLKATAKTITETAKTTRRDSSITIQIIAGSYDRVLHGVAATISPPSSSSTTSSDEATPEITFADTFLFNAHTSAIRCLALSPPSAPLPGQSQKVMLASGSTDERINVYNLSAHPPSAKPNPEAELLSSIAKRPIVEDARNRELGTLLHHSSTVTQLVFPTRSKLLSASEDSTIAVTRTRDWSLLSTIKAPVPNVFGRPSGDTAPMGGTPSGVNDFAVHPSMKVMISVSKGERCMRLWNLVTGKKAGVLDFGRDMMQDIGEPRHSSGEGRRVIWGSSKSEGDEFAVGFDRDVLVFGMDSKVRCKVMPDSRTKVHKFAYVQTDAAEEISTLAVGTEDGRIMFFSTATEDLDTEPRADSKTNVPRAKLLAFVGGKEAGVAGRVKDFKILQPENAPGVWYIVTASSDGKLRVWELSAEDIKKPEKSDSDDNLKPAGKLLGTFETQNRITCVEAFIMIPRPEGVEESEEELEDLQDESVSDSDDE